MHKATRSSIMSNTNTPDQVDVRGPRFAAWVTTAVLVVTLIVSGISPLAAAVILGAQAVIFAIGAVAGPRRHPYGLVFANVVAPRLGPVREREPVAPLKFAQLVGLVFAVLAVAGFASGAFLLGVVATAAALVAAFLNAAFGICLGCQLYPLVVRLKPAPSITS
jgi:membrane associated rhomboid family serine protease